MAFITLEGGQLAASVLIGDRRYWIARSPDGLFLNGLFLNEAAALGAIRSLLLTVAIEGVIADPLTPYQLDTPDRRYVLLANEHQYYCTLIDCDAVDDLQAEIDRIMGDYPRLPGP